MRFSFGRLLLGACALALLPFGVSQTAGRADDAKEAKAVRCFELADRIHCIAISPDSKWALTNTQLWNTATGEKIRRFEPRDGQKTPLIQEGCQVAFSPDGKFVATGNSKGPILLWEVATGREVWRAFDPPTMFGNTPQYHTCVAFTPDGTLLVSGGRDGMIRLWSVETGKEVRSIRWIEPVNVSGLATAKVLGAGTMKELCVTADGKQIAVFGLEAKFRPHPEPPTLFELETGKRLHRVENPPAANEYYASTTGISPDGRWLIWGNCTGGSPANSNRGSITLWDVKAGKPLQRWETDGYPESVAWSRDRRYVAAVVRERVQCWETEKGGLVLEFKGHAKKATAIAFSPDGKHILSASREEKAAYLWARQ
jgi:WD40 repeat protein